MSLRECIVCLIEEQTEKVQKGEPSRITCKMNVLTNPLIIESLYEVSQDEVRKDLIIRGICCLRLGPDGISANIRVVSLVGHFSGTRPAFVFGI